MIGEQHFRQRLVVGQGHAARIAAGVCLPHQFQITNDVLIVKRVAMKLLEQIESDVRLVLHQCIANYVQLVIEPDRVNIMAHLLER